MIIMMVIATIKIIVVMIVITIAILEVRRTIKNIIRTRPGKESKFTL